MKMLVVDCCIRGEESRTKKLYEAFLENISGDYNVEILNLNHENLVPVTREELYERELRIKKGEKDSPVFRYANQFKAADVIVIAAPYWDLSFPSLLKVYLEHVAIVGITFGYEENGSVGYCHGDKIVYLSTCGGYIEGRHLGAEYVREFAQMLGIREFASFTVEGLDIDPLKAEEILQDGIYRMKSEISL